MIGGNLAGGSIPKNLTFNLIIDTVRRKKLLDALMSADFKKKANGMKVLEVFLFDFYLFDQICIYFPRRSKKSRSSFKNSKTIQKMMNPLKDNS